MGDSNGQRFLPFPSDRVQVDCYPGGKFHHAAAVLAKITAPQPHVRRVILSFGINNRSAPVDASARQAFEMFERACTAFPHASIRVPLINAGAGLPRPQRDALDDLNGRLDTHVPTIPLLPGDQFATGHDSVHWTAATASRLQDHWAAHWR